MTPTALHDLTLAEASTAIGAGTVSASEYVGWLAERTRALEPQLNAYISPTLEEARRQAAHADAAIARGERLGPLHGIPFAVKDIYDTAGILTSGGSATCIDRVPERDATAVTRLRRAGAILTGKLNTHEFAHGGPSFDLPWAPSRNPWNTGHFTGGSSSGSGAAVAAGLVPASLGSDTGGSIRGPAGLCGIAGLKPTYGLVSRAGVLPNSYSYDHCGPMARTSQDCALLLDAIAGYDPADPASAMRQPGEYAATIGAGVKGLRIGVVRHFWERDTKVHDELPAAMEAALVALRSLGAMVADVTMRPAQVYSDVKIVTAESELFSLHLAELRRRPGAFGQDFRARSLAACLFTAEDYVRASRIRREITTEMRDVFRRFDLLVTANTSAAPRIDAHDPLAFWRTASLTAPFNCTGGPALAVLCGFTKAGLPLSLQIVGAPFDDARVLAAGHAYEQATGFWKHRPVLNSGSEAAPIRPAPWRPDTTAVPASVRQRATEAALHAGLQLSEPIIEELVAVAPWALAMAARLHRGHAREAEISSIFDIAREVP